MKLRPLELRIRLYDEVHRLRSLGLSHRKIIKEIEGRYGVRLSRSHVSYWIRNLHNPRNSVKLLPEDVKPSEELAWLIAVVAGDGSTWLRGKYHYLILLRCKDLDFAMEFKRCFETVTRCKAYIGIMQGLYEVVGYSRTLYNLLKKPLDLEKLRPYIEYSEKTIAAFLRGFYDSEGSIDKKGHICVSNTDLKLLAYVKELLLKLKIEVTGPHLSMKKETVFYDRKIGKIYYRRKDTYYLYVRASSRRRFAELVGFTIKRKMDRLAIYIQQPSPNFSLLQPHTNI